MKKSKEQERFDIEEEYQRFLDEKKGFYIRKKLEELPKSFSNNKWRCCTNQL